MTESDSTNSTRTPQQEPAPTPLVSTSQLLPEDYPTIHVPEGRRYALREHASQIADTWSGSTENHYKGLLGEAAVIQYLNTEDDVNVEVYADGGDGGVDLTYQGATIDVKTVGRRHCDPQLTVGIRESLNADYYALVSRIGPSDLRLIGYAPKHFVANAPILNNQGDRYHVVDQEYLFPFSKPQG